MYVVYVVLRYSLLGDVEARAFANAERVIAFEKAIGIYHEPAIQQWLIAQAKWLVVLSGWSYTLGFLPVLAAIAAIVFLLQPEAFAKYRNVFLISIGLTWSLYMLFPLAPPRLLPAEGFVDAIAVFGPDLYTSKESMSLYNPYSAMPSMHFGWPALFGVMLYRTGVPVLRVVAFAYPAILWCSVIATANHYFVDTIAGGLVVAASFGLYRVWHELRRPRGLPLPV